MPKSSWKYYLLLLLLVMGCRKIIQEPLWDVDLLAPLAVSTLSITDLVQDSLISVDADNSLKLVYDNNVFSLKLDSLFEIPDTAIANTFSLPISITVPAGAKFLDNTTETRYQLQGVELTQALIRTGSAEVNLINDTDEGILFTYTIPIAIKDGDTLRISEFIAAQSTLTKTLDLAGYSLDLRGEDLNDFNTLVTNVTATMNPAAFGPYTIKQTDIVTSSTVFSDIVPEHAVGYFGDRSFSISADTVGADIFKNIPSGSFDFNQFDVTLELRNSIGAELSANISRLVSINEAQNDTATLQHAFIGTEIFVDRAAEVFSTYPPVSTSNHIIQLDQTNSNLDELIENRPDLFGYTIDLQINPLGNVSNGHDFVYYNTGIDLFLSAEIPICISAEDLVFIDTVEFNLSDDDKTAREQGDRVQSGNLILYADNGYPFHAGIQLFLLDSNMTLLDSLAAPGSAIASAPLNGQLRVETPQRSVVYLPVNSEKIDRLYEASHILFKVTFTTADQPNFVKIYDDYLIDLKLVGDIRYEVNIN